MTHTANSNTSRQTTQSSLAALGLAMSLTLVTLLSLDHLATAQHAQASGAGSSARI